MEVDRPIGEAVLATDEEEFVALFERRPLSLLLLAMEALRCIMLNEDGS